jgi:hypothetical protein
MKTLAAIAIFAGLAAASPITVPPPPRAPFSRQVANETRIGWTRCDPDATGAARWSCTGEDSDCAVSTVLGNDNNARTFTCPTGEDKGEYILYLDTKSMYRKDGPRVGYCVGRENLDPYIVCGYN